MWPKVAAHFGTTVKPNQFAHAADSISSVGSTVSLADNPPVTAFATEAGLESHAITKQSKVEQQIDLVKWSQREDVVNAWKKLAQREGLREDVFEKATWGFLGFVLGRAFDMVIDMSKARKVGWTGYRNTWECLQETFGELGEAGAIPKK